MISLGFDLRILIASKPVDFRKGINGPAALVSTTLGGTPYSGGVYIFRSKRRDRLKMVIWNGSGMVLVTNDLNSYYISLLASVEGFGLIIAMVKRGDAINELVPSAALLLRQARRWKLVQAIVPVVGLAVDEDVFGPSSEGYELIAPNAIPTVVTFLF